MASAFVHQLNCQQYLSLLSVCLDAVAAEDLARLDACPVFRIHARLEHTGPRLRVAPVLGLRSTTDPRLHEICSVLEGVLIEGGHYYGLG